MLEAFLILIVDGLGGCLGKALTVEILTGDLWHITSIAWNVLCLDVLSWATDPVLALDRVVAELDLVELRVLGGRVDMVISLLICGLADSNVDVVLGWLLPLAGQQAVDVTGGAAIDLVLLGNVTGVAWQVLLVVFDEGFRTHF